MIPGIDDSAMQGRISTDQWVEMFGQGKRWVMHRLAQGTGNVDGTFFENMKNSRAAGLFPGAYCVYLPGTGEQFDPLAQAHDWFNRSKGLGTNLGELPPAIDFEIASKELTQQQELDALCVVIQTMTSLWGRPPLLYTYPDFWKRIIAVATPEQLSIIATCLLWFACYQDNPPTKIPAPFTTMSFWQSSGGNKFNIPGGQPADEDFFMGSEDELAQLTSFVLDIGPNPLAGVPFPLAENA